MSAGNKVDDPSNFQSNVRHEELEFHLVDATAIFICDEADTISEMLVSARISRCDMRLESLSETRISLKGEILV